MIRCAYMIAPRRRAQTRDRWPYDVLIDCDAPATHILKTGPWPTYPLRSVHLCRRHAFAWMHFYSDVLTCTPLPKETP